MGDRFYVVHLSEEMKLRYLFLVKNERLLPIPFGIAMTREFELASKWPRFISSVVALYLKVG